jgi:hypothetical protein
LPRSECLGALVLAAFRDDVREGVRPLWLERLHPQPVEIAQVAADFGKEVAARLYSEITPKITQKRHGR